MARTATVPTRNLTAIELIDAVRDGWHRWAGVPRCDRPGRKRVEDLIAAELNIGRVTVDRLRRISDALLKAEESGDQLMIAQLSHRLTHESIHAADHWLAGQKQAAKSQAVAVLR